jgi:hypothetical protein
MGVNDHPQGNQKGLIIDEQAAATRYSPALRVYQDRGLDAPISSMFWSVYNLRIDTAFPNSEIGKSYPDPKASPSPPRAPNQVVQA